MSLATPVAAAPCTGAPSAGRNWAGFLLRLQDVAWKLHVCRGKLILYLTAGKIQILERSKEFLFHENIEYINETIASAHGSVFCNHHIKQNGFSEVKWLADTAKLRRKCVHSAPSRKLVSLKAWNKSRISFPLSGNIWKAKTCFCLSHAEIFAYRCHLRAWGLFLAPSQTSLHGHCPADLPLNRKGEECRKAVGIPDGWLWMCWAGRVWISPWLTKQSLLESSLPGRLSSTMRQPTSTHFLEQRVL